MRLLNQTLNFHPTLKSYWDKSWQPTRRRIFSEGILLGFYIQKMKHMKYLLTTIIQLVSSISLFRKLIQEAWIWRKGSGGRSDSPRGNFCEDILKNSDRTSLSSPSLSAPWGKSTNLCSLRRLYLYVPGSATFIQLTKVYKPVLQKQNG